jgi:hypothetical protein
MERSLVVHSIIERTLPSWTVRARPGTPSKGTDASRCAPRGSFTSRFTGWGQEGATGPVSFFR